jgi:hypothetical protein
MVKKITIWSPCDKCTVDIIHREDCTTLRKQGAIHYSVYTFCNPCYNTSFLKEIDDHRDKKKREYLEKGGMISADDIPDNLIDLLWENPKIDSETAKNEVSKSFTLLTDKERYIISRRFVLFDEEHATIMQLAKEYKVTVERLRQIYRKALRKLKYPTHIELDNDDDIIT